MDSLPLLQVESTEEAWAKDPESPRSEQSESASAWLASCIKPPGASTAESTGDRAFQPAIPATYKQPNLTSGSLICFYDRQGNLLVVKQNGRHWELQPVPTAFHQGLILQKCSRGLQHAFCSWSAKQVNKMVKETFLQGVQGYRSCQLPLSSTSSAVAQAWALNRIGDKSSIEAKYFRSCWFFSKWS